MVIEASTPNGTGVQPVSYLRAPYLQIQDRGGAAYLVVNILTKKQYQLSHAAVGLLQRLAAPCTAAELHAAMAGESAEAIDDFLEYLLVEELIVPAGAGGLNRKCRMSSRNINLFEFPDFDPVEDPPSVVVAGIPFGRGNAIPNHIHRAPHALRAHAASLNMRIGSDLDPAHLSGLYGREIAWDRLLEHAARRRLRDWGDLFIFGHELSDVVYGKIRTMAGTLFDGGHAPLFIGGDHSVSLPLIAACALRHPGLHVIQIDAHTDTYHHRLDDFYDDIATHHHGNFASRCMELDGVAMFHQFGIRGGHNLTGRAAHAKQRIHYIGETCRIAAGEPGPVLPPDVPCYVTLDIDAIDPSEAPGTCTPMPGGLRYRELVALLDQLLRGLRVVGADIVEIDVERDARNVTTQIGVELSLLLVNFLQPAANRP